MRADERGPSRIDLHTHSTRSDGVLPPAELYRQMPAPGRRLVAITDHDTLAGVRELRAAGAGAPDSPSGESSGPRLIVGVEINSLTRRSDALGEASSTSWASAWTRPTPRFEAALERQRAGRDGARGGDARPTARSWACPSTRPFAAIVADADPTSIGRPHVARAHDRRRSRDERRRCLRARPRPRPARLRAASRPRPAGGHRGHPGRRRAGRAGALPRGHRAPVPHRAAACTGAWAGWRSTTAALVDRSRRPGQGDGRLRGGPPARGHGGQRLPWRRRCRTPRRPSSCDVPDAVEAAFLAALDQAAGRPMTVRELPVARRRPACHAPSRGTRGRARARRAWPSSRPRTWSCRASTSGRWAAR